MLVRETQGAGKVLQDADECTQVLDNAHQHPLAQDVDVLCQVQEDVDVLCQVQEDVDVLCQVQEDVDVLCQVQEDVDVLCALFTPRLDQVQ